MTLNSSLTIPFNSLRLILVDSYTSFIAISKTFHCIKISFCSRFSKPSQRFFIIALNASSIAITFSHHILRCYITLFC